MAGELIVVEQTTFPWERMRGEPSSWYYRFHDYLMLGPNRTIAAAMRKNKKTFGSRSPWTAKSITWNWINRADAYDHYHAKLEEEMRNTVMHAGLALDWKRVQILNEIAEDEADIYKNLRNEIRQDPQGQNEALTKRLVAVKGSLDKTMDAISQETGGRVKRVSIKRDLRDFAIELARRQGYDEAVALQIADMVSQEGPQA